MDRQLQSRATRAVRAADESFQRLGGSSRHWVRDAWFPALELEGLAVVDAASFVHLVAVAEDVRDWLRKTDRGGTAHERSLSEALDALRENNASGGGMTDTRLLTRAERDTVVETIRLGSWGSVQNPIQIVERYEATLTQAEAQIVELEHIQHDYDMALACCMRDDRKREDEIARLKAVACEWEPYVGYEVEVYAKDRLQVNEQQLSRIDAGRLAATLAHFARTGGLPK